MLNFDIKKDDPGLMKRHISLFLITTNTVYQNDKSYISIFFSVLWLKVRHLFKQVTKWSISDWEETLEIV